MSTLPPPWRVLWRTPRGTSVEQFHTYPEARRAYSSVAVGTRQLWSLTLWELTWGDWLLTDQLSWERLT